jgi:hypothetical protein
MHCVRDSTRRRRKCSFCGEGYLGEFGHKNCPERPLIQKRKRKKKSGIKLMSQRVESIDSSKL